MLAALKGSLFAWAGFTALGVLSMGALGAGVYASVQPVLGRFYGGVGQWSGDWVWPTLIGIGLVWPLAFPLAGALRWWLARLDMPTAVGVAAYVVVLWMVALLTCWAFLAARYTI